jgi:thiamine-phosphate diphosphorylase
MPAAAVRAIADRPFLIGRSVHSAGEALNVTADGELDYLIFGPVFETASKPGQAPAGLAALRQVSLLTRVPVLAVGGISPDRLPLVASSGAAGAAAIGMFASTPAADLLSVVAESAMAFDTQGGRSLT